MRARWIGGALVLAAAGMPAQYSQASSHREAPFITRMPKVDGTDFYMFRSYEAGRGEYVTLIANYQPLQDAYGGPNYFTMDPDAIYEIHVDADGDSVEDTTFQFDFDSALASSGSGIRLAIGSGANQKMVAVPFTNVGMITGPGTGVQNVNETYTIKIIRGDRRTGTAADITRAGGGTTFDKPLDNIGDKTFGPPPAYQAYANQFIYDIDIPGCTEPGGSSAKVFVGQRAVGFAVNLGQIFDLVNGGVGAPGIVNLVGAQDQGFNIVGNKNVTSLAIEVPAACLFPNGDDGVIGGWTTASVRQARVINPAATYEQPSREGGPWVQVSRLGIPLVNEVVIGLPDKDKFNGSEPADDATNFADYVTHPTLPAVLELLFGGAGVTAPTNIPRTDLLGGLLVGISDGAISVNVNGASPIPSDMLRLNTSPAVLGPPTPEVSQNALGAALCVIRRSSLGGTQSGFTIDPTNPGCDPHGFPNGRRPGDDTVDIALRVMLGYLAGTDVAASGGLPVVDGAFLSPTSFRNTFPYLNTPTPGSP
jgi:hypothetical protein